jgi:hypothetical protein
MADATSFVLQLSILLVAAIADGLMIRRFGYPVALVILVSNTIFIAEEIRKFVMKIK